jgi:osmotically-inducible protein OsmY
MQKPNFLLESDVRDQLATDPLLDDSRVEVSVNNGAVTLRGTVPTYFDSVHAVEDAGRVSGVRSVDNELLVGLMGEAIADADIAAACTRALDGDRFVPKGAVTVGVDNGWVTLSGHVRHHYERMAAEHALRRVDGIRGVSDKVEINGDPIPTDVVDRINKALTRSSQIAGSSISVSSSGHTIFLDGTTTTWTARVEAEDAAWDAPGVENVVDRTTVVA